MDLSMYTLGHMKMFLTNKLVILIGETRKFWLDCFIVTMKRVWVLDKRKPYPKRNG